MKHTTSSLSILAVVELLSKTRNVPTISASNGVKNFDVVSAVPTDDSFNNFVVTLNDLTTAAAPFTVTGDKINEYTFSIVDLGVGDWKFRDGSCRAHKGQRVW